MVNKNKNKDVKPKNKEENIVIEVNKARTI